MEYWKLTSLCCLYHVCLICIRFGWLCYLKKTSKPNMISVMFTMWTKWSNGWLIERLRVSMSTLVLTLTLALTTWSLMTSISARSKMWTKTQCMRSWLTAVWLRPLRKLMSWDGPQRSQWKDTLKSCRRSETECAKVTWKAFLKRSVSRSTKRVVYSHTLQ